MYYKMRRGGNAGIECLPSFSLVLAIISLDGEEQEEEASAIKSGRCRDLEERQRGKVR